MEGRSRVGVGISCAPSAVGQLEGPGFGGLSSGARNFGERQDSGIEFRGCGSNSASNAPPTISRVFFAPWDVRRSSPTFIELVKRHKRGNGAVTGAPPQQGAVLPQMPLRIQWGCCADPASGHIYGPSKEDCRSGRVMAAPREANQGGKGAKHL